MYINIHTYVYLYINVICFKTIIQNTLNLHGETIMSDDRPTLLHIFLYSFESTNKRAKFVTETFVLARDLIINLYTNSNRIWKKSSLPRPQIKLLTDSFL